MSYPNLTARELALAVIEYTRLGLQVAPAAPNRKAPLGGTQWTHQATSNTDQALGLMVAASRMLKRGKTHQQAGKEAKRALWAAECLNAPVDQFAACADDNARVALFEHLMLIRSVVPNLIVRTGDVSLLVVLDYDPRNDDEKRTQGYKLAEQFGDALRATRSFYTPHDGGRHFWFRLPEALVPCMLRGHLALEPAAVEGPTGEYSAIEVKGHGQIVYAYPSVVQPHWERKPTKDDAKAQLWDAGGLYRQANTNPIQPLPPELAACIVKSGKRAEKQTRFNDMPEMLKELFDAAGVNNTSLGAVRVIGALADTRANRRWFYLLLKARFVQRPRNGRGRWERNHWWKTLGAILLTGWPDALDLAKIVSMDESASWNPDEFEIQTADIQARADTTEMLFTWRGMRDEAFNNGYAGRYNPPDLTPGDYLKTPERMTDDQLVIELTHVSTANLTRWAAHNVEQFNRVRSALTLARAQIQETCCVE